MPGGVCLAVRPFRCEFIEMCAVRLEEHCLSMVVFVIVRSLQKSFAQTCESDGFVDPFCSDGWQRLTLREGRISEPFEIP